MHRFILVTCKRAKIPTTSSQALKEADAGLRAAQAEAGAAQAACSAVNSEAARLQAQLQEVLVAKGRLQDSAVARIADLQVREAPPCRTSAGYPLHLRRWL